MIKSDVIQVRELQARLAQMNSAADVTLPAALVSRLCDDTIALAEYQAALYAYEKRLEQMPQEPVKKRRLELVRNDPTGGDAA